MIELERKISNCCGVEDRGYRNNDGELECMYSDLELCPKCNEYCAFIEPKEFENLGRKTK